MPDAKSTANGVGGSFWDRYIAILDKQGIKRNAGRWYVRRAESFIKATAGHQLAELTARDVTLYLENLGRKSRIQAWQFRQAVDAIQILLHLAQAPCTASINWEYWRTSAQERTRAYKSVEGQVLKNQFLPLRFTTFRSINGSKKNWHGLCLPDIMKGCKGFLCQDSGVSLFPARLSLLSRPAAWSVLYAVLRCLPPGETGSGRGAGCGGECRS